MTALGWEAAVPVYGCDVRFAIKNRTFAPDLCNGYTVDLMEGESPCRNLPDRVENPELRTGLAEHAAGMDFGP